MKTSSLKKLKSAIRKNISMKDFFMSDVFKNHFSSIVKMVSNRYNNAAMRVKLDWKGNDIAYTDNRLIFINLNNSLVKDIESLDDRYLCYLGLLGHELGHVLFTDFESDDAWLKCLKAGNIYCGYSNDYKKAAKEILDKKELTDALFKLYRSIQNCIEDGYVNYAISKQFPGTFKSGLKMLHEVQFGKEAEICDNDISNLLNATLWIAVRGMLPECFLNKYPCLSEVKSAIGDIKKADTMDKRIFITNNVILIIWEYIKDFLNNLNNQNGQSSDSDSSSGQSSESSSAVVKIIIKAVAQSKESSERGKGTGITCSPNESEKDKGSSKKESSDNDSTDNDSTDNEKEDKSSISSEKENSDNDSTEGKEEKEEFDNKDTDSKGNNTSKNDKENSEDSTEEKEEFDNKDTDSDNADSDSENNKENSEDNGSNSKGNSENSKENNNSSDNSDSEFNSGLNINSINNQKDVPADVSFSGDDSSNIEESAERVIDQLMSKLTDDILKKHPKDAERILAQENADNIINDGNSCHYGYPFEIKTVKTKGFLSKNKYDSISKGLMPISKRLQKKISDVLEEKQDGGVCKNLLKGNKINPAASASSKGRIFKRTNLPESQELAVSVLIDESGSMSGRRIEKAFEMAVVIEDFCRGLNIPLSISGHSDYRRKEVVKDYIRFGDEDKNRKYNLAEMAAGGCNRDGLALRYCVSNLKQRDEEMKLMIIISDGRPNSDSYWGASAEKDLTDIKKDFEKSGGRLIAASIGDDKDTLKRIYQDSFLDITDLNQLPLKMLNLISKYIN